MTIPNYFEHIIRDDESVSTSPDFDTSHREAKVEAPPLYSVISKACLACARPPVDQVDDNITASTGIAENINGWELSSSLVPPTPRNEGKILKCSNFKSYSFAELNAATRNFRPSASVKGTFDLVFKGYVDEHTLTATKLGMGIAIAVKLLNIEGFRCHEKWVKEVRYLGQLYHPNLVRLLGYCLEKKHRMLVYEFTPGRSLEDAIFTYFKPFSWSARMKVALGAAKGLAFLHSAEINIVHGNLRASTILLDSNYDAKVSYFGLTEDAFSQNERTKHDAPEYLITGLKTAKTDVYSFGGVLLEMLCGRRTLDINAPKEQENLVEWAKSGLKHKSKTFGFLDGHLEGQYSLEDAQRATLLALQCLSTEAKMRPNMDEVEKTLQQLNLVSGLTDAC